MTTYICKCGRRVKKSTDAATTGNRLTDYGPGHECFGCPYATPYGNFQWDEGAGTVVRETRGYECRMSKTLTYASEFAGSIKDKCTCRVHSLDFDFLSQVSAWIKDTYPDREIFGSFSKDIRASDYGSDGRYCLTITCTQNLKGVAAKRELFGQFFNPDGSRKGMTPQQEMEKILADIKKAKEILSCTPVQNADAAVTTAETAAPNAATETLTTSESEEDASALTPVTSLQNCESAPAASADGSSVSMPSAPGFDFSPLGDLAGAAADADQQFDLHYGTAQDEYLVSCIYLARIHALTAKAGRYGGGTWTKWYESKGLSEGSARTMVKNGDAFNSATVAELKQLPNLTRKDLNLITRSGCADQVVAAAGDSQRVQDLLAQIKSKDAQLEAAHADISGLKDRATAAEAREEEAWSMVSKAQDEAKAAQENLDYEVGQNDALHEEKGQLLRECEAAKQARAEAEARAKDAENQLAGSRQVAEAAKLRGDKLKAENDALKKQPITGVVDKDEVKRQAEALSRNAVQEARQQAAEAQARLRQYQEDAEGLLAPAQACAQQAQFIADSVRAMYLNWFGSAVAADASLAQMGTPLYAVCGEIMSSLEEENTINPTAAGSEEDAEREALFE